MVMKENSLYNKVAGCLLGGALADAKGYHLETDHTWRFSAVTQMTLFTLEGMVYGYWRANEKGIGADVECYVYEAYKTWLNTQGIETDSLWKPVSELFRCQQMHHRRDPGQTCIEALQSKTMGTIKQPVNHSKGCAAVYRAAPLGFMTCWGNPILTAARTAALTHGHPMAWISAGFYAGLIHQLINKENADLKKETEIILLAMENLFALYKTECNAFLSLIRKAVFLSEQDETDEALPELGNRRIAEEALTAALYCCLKTKNYHDAVELACQLNPERPDISGMTGSIAGALYGLDHMDVMQNLECRDLILYCAQCAVKAELHHQGINIDEEKQMEEYIHTYLPLVRKLYEDAQLNKWSAPDDMPREYAEQVNTFLKDTWQLPFFAEYYRHAKHYEKYIIEEIMMFSRKDIAARIIAEVAQDYTNSGYLMHEAIGKGKLYHLMEAYAKASGTNQSTKYESHPEGMRKITQLDLKRIWFLTTYYDKNKKVRKYSLDKETADDSHYEFTDAESIRAKINDGSNRTFEECLRKYTLENSGEKTLSLIYPYIVAQFHY
ncbi:MAG: ADP-ribosylglycohydrolase family protein [Solobacterium sp.]|nr:ADP-ribosylglycohydrolase family protein [Solobacterium sp.]